jgi:hypothetical protein
MRNIETQRSGIFNAVKNKVRGLFGKGTEIAVAKAISTKELSSPTKCEKPVQPNSLDKEQPLRHGIVIKKIYVPEYSDRTETYTPHFLGGYSESSEDYYPEEFILKVEGVVIKDGEAVRKKANIYVNKGFFKRTDVGQYVNFEPKEE